MWYRLTILENAVARHGSQTKNSLRQLIISMCKTANLKNPTQFQISHSIVLFAFIIYFDKIAFLNTGVGIGGKSKTQSQLKYDCRDNIKNGLIILLYLLSYHSLNQEMLHYHF